MANNEKITEIIDDKAFQQIERLSSLLVTAQGDLVKSIEVAAKFNNEIGKSKSISDFVINQDKASKAMANAQKATEKIRLEEIKLAQAREKAFDNYEKKLQKQIESVNKRERQAETNNKRELDRIAKENKANEQLSQRQAKEAAAYSKRITEQSRVYNQLSAVLEKNRKDAKDIGIVYGENSVQFQKAAKSVIELDARLKSLDAKLGQNQRNVGNYKSGFNGLSNSINQITRELPAFTFSAQTGFLALSNNIPILVDNIQQTQREITTLRAQGEKVPGLFKQLASSFFSFGTALSIGITLFTIYGKEIGEFVSALFKGTDALDAFTQAQNERNRSAKAFNEVILEGTQNAQKELVSLNINKKAIENENIPREERNKLVDNLQKEYPKYFGNLTNEEILAGNVGGAYKNLAKDILSAALARAAQDKIVENSSRILANELAIENERANNLKLRAKEQKELLSAQQQSQLQTGGSLGGISTGNLSNEARITAASKAKAASDKIIFDLASDTKKLNQDNLKLYGKINTEVEKTGASALLGFKGATEESEKFNTSALELAKFRAETISNININIFENEKTSYDDRLKSLDIFTKKQIEIADLERQISLKKEDLNANERLLIEETYQENVRVAKLRGAKTQADILKETLDKEDKERIEANRIALVNIEIQRDQNLLALNDEFNKGKISKEQYEKDKLEIQKIYAQQAIREEIKQTQDFIDLAKKRGDETADAEAKLAALRLKYSDEVTSKKLEDIALISEKEKALADFIIGAAQETTQIVSDLGNIGFQKRIAEIDAEIEKVQIQADFERQQVNDSILSANEKQIKLAQIDASAAAKQKVLEDKKIEVQKKQAKFQKAVAIANIIQQTALAVISTLAQVPKFDFGISAGVLAAVAAATGAAQIATVLATPIPAFEEGGTMKKTGLAMFGEVGTEGRINPDGSFELTPSVPTVGKVQAGTQFISNKDLMKMIAKPDKVNYVGGEKIDMKEVIAALEKNGKRTEQAFKSIPINQTNITKAGWRETQKRNNGWTQYLNSKF